MASGFRVGRKARSLPAQLLLLGCTGVTSYNSFHVPLRRSSTNGGSSRAALAAGLGGGNAREKVGLPKAVDDTTSGGPGGFLRRTDTTNLPSGDGNADVPFIVLGIETSCDDTGAAIVTSDGEILGEALASQAALHEEWGGVVPGIARDAHEAALDGVVAEALARANMSSVDEVDAIGVTVGPGLEICLRVGTEGAKALAAQYGKAFVGVHHLEAHVFMARLAAGAAAVPFPFLTLLTSGGHCQLLLTRGVGQHVVLGSTLDDALGEAFDKVARLLELPIGGGGGPALEKLARDGNRTGVALPIPMRSKKNLDFSFAGLKTAVRVAVQKTPEDVRDTHEFRADVAASFQHAAFSHLEQRLSLAFKYCSDLAHSPDEADAGPLPSTLVVSGGVAANLALRERLQALCDRTDAPRRLEPLPPAAGDPPAPKWQLVIPPPRLCTDNGVMVAWAAVEALRLGIAHDPEGQEVRARWPLGRLANGVGPAPTKFGGSQPKSGSLRKGVQA